MNKIRKRMASDEKETRTYKITGRPAHLDGLEELLYTMQLFGNLGHSDTVRVFIDGDGAFHIKVEKEDGELAQPTEDVDELVDKEIFFDFE